MAIIPSTSSRPGAMSISAPGQARQKKLIIIFIVVVIVTGVFWYFNFSSPNTDENQAITLPNSATQSVPAGIGVVDQIRNQEEVPSLENVELDFSLFKNLKFGALRDFTSDLDVSGAEKGRRNPFIKY